MNIRVLYLITSLGTGGAESFLLKLIRTMSRDRFDVVVLSLKRGGELKPAFEAAGIDVVELGATINPLLLLRALWMLAKELFRFKPHIVHSWMYHADFLTLLIRFIYPKTKVIWCIRNLSLSPSHVKSSTRAVAYFNALVSRYIPHKIVCNADRAKNYHIEYGYHCSKFHVIPNGFDTSLFCPDLSSGLLFRNKHGIRQDAFVIGMVARFHPVKGHKSLILVMDNVLAKYNDVCLVLVGGGHDDKLINSLIELVHNKSIESRVKFVMNQTNMSAVYNSFDLLISNSESEGFSNVIGEAMSCNIPVIVTDVGDSSKIVGPFGILVESKNSDDLNHAICWHIAHKSIMQTILARYLRNWIKHKYSLEHSVSAYEYLYREILNGA